MATSDNRRDEIIFRGTYENILDTEGAEIFCNDFYILYDFLRRFPVHRHFPIFHLVQCPVCLSFLLTDVGGENFKDLRSVIRHGLKRV